MKLKRLSILICIILVALCAIALISCGSEEEVEITFNSDGGTAIKPIKAMTGDKISAPVAPKKDGYKLDGWYNGDEKWNFEKDKVKGEMTLTAKWTWVYHLQSARKHCVLYRHTPNGRRYLCPYNPFKPRKLWR